MAIEPIKGFYVHDEVTDTDGVAKYDYDELTNKLVNEPVVSAGLTGGVIYPKLNGFTGSGITLSGNKEQGYYSVSGTCTGYFNRQIGTVDLKAGEFYKLHVLTNGQAMDNTWYIYLRDVDGTNVFYYEGNLVAPKTDCVVGVRIAVNNAITVNSSVFPYIEHVDTTSAKQVNPYLTMQVGNVNFGSSPTQEFYWSYTSTSRMCSLQGVPLHLKKGDIVSLNDRGAYTLFIGWINEDGTTGRKGWTSSPVMVETDADYYFLIRYATESTITDPFDTANAITVYCFGEVSEYAPKSEYFIKGINHRGWSQTAPENTIPAFLESKKHGYKYVETDVRFTSDMVPVLLHDETINRTARNADGTTISETINISSITYEQALEYDFGIYKGATYAGTKIPTLGEFMKICRAQSLYPYIEVKQYDVASLAVITDIVKSYGMIDNVTFISFGGVTAYDNIGESVRFGILGSMSQSMIDEAYTRNENGGNVFLDIDSNSITTELIEYAKSKNVAVECYTINGWNSFKNLNNYISGATSDWYIAGYVLENNYA